jgi:hypothetical protein
MLGAWPGINYFSSGSGSVFDTITGNLCMIESFPIGFAPRFSISGIDFIADNAVDHFHHKYLKDLLTIRQQSVILLSSGQ